MDADDYRIVKIVVFSRAVTSGVKLVGEITGLYEPVENYDDKRIFTIESVLALTSIIFTSYVFTYEIGAMSTSLKRQFI